MEAFMPSRRTLLFAGAGSLVLALAPLPALAARHSQSSARPPRRVPSSYVAAARAHGVPPVLLFAVALQESQQLWRTATGRTLLPWPWTLNIAGTPARFATRVACQKVLDDTLARGQKTVDIGLMQVCWRYHGQRFARPAAALEPLTNLDAGAAILAEHYRERGSWRRAVALYHSATPARGDAYAVQVFAHLRGLDA